METLFRSHPIRLSSLVAARNFRTRQAVPPYDEPWRLTSQPSAMLSVVPIIIFCFFYCPLEEFIFQCNILNSSLRSSLKYTRIYSALLLANTPGLSLIPFHPTYCSSCAHLLLKLALIGTLAFNLIDAVPYLCSGPYLTTIRTRLTRSWQMLSILTPIR